MTHSETARLARGRASRAKRKAWVRAYRRRISQGDEHCRNCGSVSTELTLGHLTPASKGGNLTLQNTTLLCQPCNLEQGPAIWPHLKSLAEEEDEAPPEKQWSRFAALDDPHREDVTAIDLARLKKRFHS